MPKGFKGAFRTDLTDFYLQRSVEKLSRELKEAKCKPYIRVPAPAADIGLKEGCQAAFASVQASPALMLLCHFCFAY